MEPKSLLNRQRTLLKTEKEVNWVCEVLSKERMIGLDTEFIRETTFFPKIALIQVATEREAWLLDPTALTQAALGPLMRILTDANILKVIHASYADQECLYWAYGVIAEPVLDTSVAAALCGLGDSVGLQRLLKEEINITIPKGRSRVKWLARPLSQELLEYAEQDVVHLVQLAKSLKSRLEGLNRWEWVLEESCSQKEQFEISAESMANRLAKSSHLDPTAKRVLLELVRWRESRAKTKDIPRHWVVDNDVLMSLAKVRPKGIEELKTFRGLGVKEIERSGEEILRCVQLGIEMAKKEPMETVVPIPRGPQIDGPLMNLVQSFVSYLANEHSIAHRYLLNAGQVEWLLREADKTVEDWVKLGILSARTSELVGDELKAFLGGRLALRVAEGEVAVMPVGEK